MTDPKLDELLAEVCALFERHGGRLYSGEPVTQLEHALQSALRAEQDGASDTLVTAALLHDIGHLYHDHGETPTLRAIDDRHEHAATPLLEVCFGEEVLAPIRLHVDAKRYLCARGAGAMSGAEYLARLSADSVRSLALQGGPHTAAEADAFEATPHAADALRLRLWDDAAKEEGRPTPSLEHYQAIARRAARTHRDDGAAPR